MVKARQKGANYELATIKRWHGLGWEQAVSSRSESRRLDDKGVDICYLNPFNVQCKSWERAPSYHDVLASMPKDGNYNVLFHKKNRRGTVVVLTEEDFFKIVKLLVDNGIIIPKC
jgi:hypothetical protein